MTINYGGAAVTVTIPWYPGDAGPPPAPVPARPAPDPPPLPPAAAARLLEPVAA